VRISADINIVFDFLSISLGELGGGVANGGKGIEGSRSRLGGLIWSLRLCYTDTQTRTHNTDTQGHNQADVACVRVGWGEGGVREMLGQVVGSRQGALWDCPLNGGDL
jgi:hypothetical protein